MISDPERDETTAAEVAELESRPGLPNANLNVNGTAVRPDFDLIDLWKILWRDRWIAAAIVAVFFVTAVVYAFTAKEWFRAEVLLAPAIDQTGMGLAEQIGGLANLAGIGTGLAGNVEPMAVLKSREFARDFVEDKSLLTVLLADKWDPELKRWRGDDPEDWPDVRDAVKLWDEDLRAVEEDALTGLVTLSIEWTDAQTAAEWANELVARLNTRMRASALAEAERNVAFLRSELEKAGVVELRDSIGRLLESELQKLMMARGKEEFSFRVIDKAQIPKWRSRPNRILVVLLGLILGCVVASGVVLVRSAVRAHRLQHNA